MSEDFSYVAGTYCSYTQIVRLTLPAIILNAASPATTLVQTALLGRIGSKDQVAAYAVASAFASFVITVLNFLVRSQNVSYTWV